MAPVVPSPPGANRGSDGLSPQVRSVDLRDRHLTLDATDAAVAAPGGQLTLSRTYSSTNVTVGGFGAGWSSVLDMHTSASSTGTVVTLANGQEAAFGRNADGTYGPAPGAGGTTLSGDPTKGNFTFTDTSGNVFTFTGNVLSQIADRDGRVTTMTLSGGKVVGVTDSTSGRSLGVLWSSGRVASIYSAARGIAVGGSTVPSLTGTNFKWDYSYSGTTLTSACRVSADGSSSCTRYGYDPAAPYPLTKMTAPSGATRAAISYAAGSGTVTSVTDGRGTTRFSAAATSGGQDVSVTTQSAVTDVYTLNSGGQVTELKHPDGSSELWNYNPLGQVAQFKDANGGVLVLEYNDDGALTSKTVNDSLGYVDYWYDYHYATSGAAKGRIDVSGQSPVGEYYKKPDTFYTYTDGGQLASVVKGSTADSPSKTSYAYSTGSEAAVGGGTVPARLLISQTDPVGRKTSYKYDAQGNLREQTSPAGVTTTYAYDALGNLLETKLTDATGTTAGKSTYAYAPDGRLSSVTRAEVTDPISGVKRQTKTSYTRDVDGNLTASTVADALSDQHQTSTTDYDQYGRPITVTSADGSTVVTKYDDSGNVASTTDARGQTTAYSYTPRGLPSKVTKIGYTTPAATAPAVDLVIEQNTYDAGGRLATRTDARGQTYVYGYSPANWLTSVTAKDVLQKDGATKDELVVEYTYDFVGQRSTVSTPLGKQIFSFTDRKLTTSTYTTPERAYVSSTAFSYNADGSIAAISEGSAETGQRYTAYTYDATGQVSSMSRGATADDEAPSTTWYQHDSLGRLTGVTDPRGSSAGDSAWTTTYAYDLDGNVTNVTTPSVDGIQASVAFEYDALGRLSTQVDATGQKSTYTRNNAGQITSITTPTHTTGGTSPKTTYAYSSAGDLSKATDPEGTVTTYEYDSLGNIATRTDPPLAIGEAPRTSTFLYNPAGDVTSITSSAGATVTTAYDPLGRVASSATTVTAPGKPNQQRSITYSYDNKAGTTTVTSGTGQTQTVTRDILGHVTSSATAAGTTTYAYDAQDNLTSVTDPNGNQTIGEYNPLGRMTSATLKSADGTALRSWAVGYDKAGNQISQTDPNGNTTKTAFSPLNQVTSITAPDGSVQKFGYNEGGMPVSYTDQRGNKTTATYTPAGDLASLIEPSTSAHPGAADRTTTWEYNSLGLPTKKTAPGGAQTEYAYNADDLITGITAGGQTRRFMYDQSGNLEKATDASGTNSYGYSSAGDLVSATGPSGDATFTYTADGYLASQKDATGVTNYAYDNAGQLASLTSSTAGQPVTFTYDPAGQLTKQTWGNITRALNYDASGAVTSDTTTDGDATAYAATNTYDAAGNLSSQNIAPATASGGGVTQYHYDSRNRITGWTTPDEKMHTVGWDEAGNLTNLDGTAQVFDQRNRILSSGAIKRTYNAQGQLTTLTDEANKTSYEWDSFGDLIGDGQSKNTYDALGRALTEGDATLNYAGLARTPVTVGEHTAVTGGVGLPLLSDGNLTVTNRHTDVTATITATGEAGTASYSPFGTPAAEEPPVSSGLGYQSNTTSSSGLVHMDARWYDPSAGVFASADTATVPTTDLNLYQYATGNPVNNIDATGTTSIPWDGGFSFGAGLSALSAAAGSLLNGLGAAALSSSGFAAVGAGGVLINTVKFASSTGGAAVSPVFTNLYAVAATSTVGTSTTTKTGTSTTTKSTAPASGATSAVSAASTSFSNASASLAQANSSIAQMNTSIAQMNTSIAQMNTSIAQMNATIAGIDATIAEANAHIDAFLHPGPTITNGTYTPGVVAPAFNLPSAACIGPAGDVSTACAAAVPAAAIGAGTAAVPAAAGATTTATPPEDCGPGELEDPLDCLAPQQQAKGGVYTLRDELGNVVRTGRSKDLAARRSVHRRDPVLGQYAFRIEQRTDVYAEQRGLEHMLYEQFPGARAANGGYNKIRAISPFNPKKQSYLDAARDFFLRME
nr:RHS repeat-associated core domain-containing protein [Microbacterium sp. MAH-37]